MDVDVRDHPPTGSAAGRDLCFVVDATQSMERVIAGLAHALPHIVHLARVLGHRLFDRVGVLVYRDYSERDEMMSWSGWCALEDETEVERLARWVADIEAFGGADYPEAVKSALNRLVNVIVTRPTVRNHRAAPALNKNHAREEAQLERSGDAATTFDWTTACRRLASRDATAFPVIMNSARDRRVRCFYALLAGVTRGSCLQLDKHDPGPGVIARTTVGLILRLAGHAYRFEETVSEARVDRGGDGSGSDSGDFDDADLASDLACDGLLPDAEQNVKECRVFGAGDVRVPSVICNADSDVAGMFRRDAAFRDVVYATFARILASTWIEAFTYNPVFGKLWREVCRRREDPRTRHLNILMSTGVAGAPEPLRSALRSFIDMSYDETEYVQEIVRRSVAEGCTSYLVLDDTDIGGGGGGGGGGGASTDVLTRADVLEIQRSCARPVLRRVSALLRGMRVVGKAPHEQRCRFVPLALEPHVLFRVLPHLLVRGTTFSRRGACVLAAVCACAELGSELLRAPAAQLLRACRGSWIAPDEPENFAYDFVKLVTRCNEDLGGEVLAPEEEALYRVLRTVGGIMTAADSDVQVRVGYSSLKTCRPDHKVACTAGCGQRRSFTCVAPGGACVLCLSEGPDSARAFRGDLPLAATLDPAQHPELSGEGARVVERSVWCECTDCGVHYAVIRPERLKCRPRCHACRTRAAAPGDDRDGNARPRVYAPNARCGACGNTFVDANHLAASVAGADGFACPACAIVRLVPSCASDFPPTYDLIETRVHECIARFGVAFVDESLNADITPTVLSSKTLYQAWARCTAEGVPLLARGRGHPPQPQPQPEPSLYLRGKRVVAPAECAAAVRAHVQRGRREAGVCAICYGALPKEQLRSVCGKPSRCRAVACGPCLSEWYGAATPGRVCAPTRLACPFCKGAPSSRTLVQHNRALCLLRGRAALYELDPAWHYAWCVMCNRLRPVAERVCADAHDAAAEALRGIANFRCETCVAAMGNADGHNAATKTMRCPACGVCTQKTFGCDHMTCPCGQHWCWVCGAGAEDADAVHEHIYEVHFAGYGYGDDGDNDGDEYAM